MGILMTGAFMEITNHTGQDITLTGGSCDWAASVEIHEVVNGQMQPKEGGLVIHDGATETLKPGGNHVMFMDMPAELAAGDEVEFDLSFDNGATVHVVAPVKVVNLDQEKYNSASPSPSM